MTSAILGGITYNDIKEVKQRKVKLKKARYLRVLGEELLELAHKVDKQWENLSDGERETLTILAYKIIEPPRFNFFTKLQAIFVGIYLNLIGATKELDFCVNALDKLADNILNAIEHDDPEYELAILDMLEEVKQNPEMGEVITSKNSRDKLRRLSDQAYAEL